MPLIFSYGSLQEERVQLATFGRPLRGHPDELLGGEPTRVEIEGPGKAAGGRTHHANVVFNGREDRRVPGTVFEITEAELVAADRYEAAAAYTRVATVLASGQQAWVYVDARSAPSAPVVVTREGVRAAARRLFGEPGLAEALACLDDYGASASEPERARVQLAILGLSRGQPAALRHHLEVAKRDYRDVLLWAEGEGPAVAGTTLDILRAKWAWALPEPMRVIARNPFGNLLVEAGDGSVWRVCPEDLAASRVAEAAGDLAARWADEEWRGDWAVESWVEAAASRLGPLGPDQCYGFRIWPVLGGEYGPENMAIKSTAEWLAASGDLGRQVKDLPPGTPLRLDTGQP
jgi:gamma-glutamylcyclotransferase (GGCT)/AIG2-like uncharacterized protein YtfP